MRYGSLAAVWLAAAAPAVAGELPGNVELGRLFTTPEQRRELEERRSLGPTETERAAADAPAEPPPRKKEIVGVIARSGRAPLVWRDGEFRRVAASTAEPQPADADAAETATRVGKE